MGKQSACNAGHAVSAPRLERPPGGGMAAHSTILTWRIPWIEECGRLHSMGSQRAGQD